MPLANSYIKPEPDEKIISTYLLLEDIIKIYNLIYTLHYILDLYFYSVHIMYLSKHGTAIILIFI